MSTLAPQDHAEAIALFRSEIIGALGFPRFLGHICYAAVSVRSASSSLSAGVL